MFLLEKIGEELTAIPDKTMVEELGNIAGITKYSTD